jgi:hypothetical protein
VKGKSLEQLGDGQQPLSADHEVRCMEQENSRCPTSKVAGCAKRYL